MAVVRSENSTTVRALMSLGLGLAERLAPGWVEAQAFEAWGKPRRPKRPVSPRVDGARAFHLDLGDGWVAAWEWNEAGPQGTALLVHGWSGTATHLGRYVAPLVAEGFHVVAVDLPAHGQSPGSFATVVSLARAVAALGRRLRPRVAVAHSLGATATTLALTQGLRLERVVLLAPPVELPPYFTHFATQVGLSPSMQARVLAGIERRVGVSLEQLELCRHAPQLGETQALIVHDRDDAVVPHASGEALARAWPGAQLLETSGLGHDGVRRDASVVETGVAFLTGARLLRGEPAKAQVEEAQPAPQADVA